MHSQALTLNVSSIILGTLQDQIIPEQCFSHYCNQIKPWRKYTSCFPFLPPAPSVGGGPIRESPSPLSLSLPPSTPLLREPRRRRRENQWSLLRRTMEGEEEVKRRPQRRGQWQRGPPPYLSSKRRLRPLRPKAPFSSNNTSSESAELSSATGAPLLDGSEPGGRQRPAWSGSASSAGEGEPPLGRP